MKISKCEFGRLETLPICQNRQMIVSTVRPLIYSLACLRITVCTPYPVKSKKASKNLTISIIIRWFLGSPGQMTHRPSVWCSKYYFFHDFLQNSMQKWFQCIFFIYFYKFTKKKRVLSALSLMKKYCLEHQTLGRWVISPNNPVT